MQVLLLGGLVLFSGPGCDRESARAETAAEAPAHSALPAHPENPAPTEAVPAAATADAPPSFVPATLRQEELRGIALQALQTGDNDLAIAALITLSETPEASDLRASGTLLLADLYHNEGNGERAVTILEALIASTPPLPELEFVLGRTLGELGRNAEAEVHLRRAIELGPQLLQSHLYLGSLLVADGRDEEAAAVYLVYEQTLGELLRALAAPDLDPTQRLALVDALSLANPDERITRALLELLGQRSVGANAAAVQTLAAIGTTEAIEPLLAFAELTPHPELATAARQAAEMIRQRAP